MQALPVGGVLKGKKTLLGEAALLEIAAPLEPVAAFSLDSIAPLEPGVLARAARCSVLRAARGQVARAAPLRCDPTRRSAREDPPRLAVRAAAAQEGARACLC
jgi:hypothetical protein